jgi:hypothetical protein
MQRLELKDQREFARPKHLMLKDMGSNLCRQSQRKSHRFYCAFASISTDLTGAGLVNTEGDCSWTGSALSKPGRKKDAGETLYDPFNPPQPAASCSKTAQATAAKLLRAIFFHSNFTNANSMLIAKIMASKYGFFFSGHTV